MKDINKDEVKLELALILIKALQDKTGKLNEKTIRNIEENYATKFSGKGEYK